MLIACLTRGTDSVWPEIGDGDISGCENLEMALAALSGSEKEKLSLSEICTVTSSASQLVYRLKVFQHITDHNAQSCNVTASTSPFCAWHMELYSLQPQALSRSLHFIVCDNANVVDCFRLAKCSEFNLFPKHPSSYSLKCFISSVAIVFT